MDKFKKGDLVRISEYGVKAGLYSTKPRFRLGRVSHVSHTRRYNQELVSVHWEGNTKAVPGIAVKFLDKVEQEGSPNEGADGRNSM